METFLEVHCNGFSRATKSAVERARIQASASGCAICGDAIAEGPYRLQGLHLEYSSVGILHMPDCTMTKSVTMCTLLCLGLDSCSRHASRVDLCSLNRCSMWLTHVKKCYSYIYIYNMLEKSFAKGSLLLGHSFYVIVELVEGQFWIWLPSCFAR